MFVYLGKRDYYFLNFDIQSICEFEAKNIQTKINYCKLIWLDENKLEKQALEHLLKEGAVGLVDQEVAELL